MMWEQHQTESEKTSLDHADESDRTESSHAHGSKPIALTYAANSDLPTKVGIFAYLMMLAEGIALAVGVAFELRARGWPADSVYADGNYGLAALCYAICLVLAAVATTTLGVKVYTRGVRRSRSCLFVMLACIGMALVVFIRLVIDLIDAEARFG